jgi:5,10-methylenetetrahydromethanopterin reductase
MLRVSVLSLSKFSPTELAEFARHVEELGFDGLWLADERFYHEAYTSLAYCAAQTRTLRLGVGVTDPYSRHPALTAMAIATLDQIAAGRAILGIGAGVSGFEELGLERARPARAIREAIQVIRGLLRGERVELEGEVIHFRGGRLDFSPRRSDIPIYVASNNRLGLQVAGEVADGAIMQGCVSERILRFFAEQVAAGAARAGRPAGSVERVARISVCIADDRRAALDALRPAIAVSLIAQQPRFWSFEQAGFEVPDELRARVTGIRYTHDPAVILPIAALIPDEWVDALTIGGDAAHVAEQVNRLAERAIGHFMLYPVPARGGPLELVQTFARDVLPLVRAASQRARS